MEWKCSWLPPSTIILHKIHVQSICSNKVNTRIHSCMWTLHIVLVLGVNWWLFSRGKMHGFADSQDTISPLYVALQSKWDVELQMRYTRLQEQGALIRVLVFYKQYRSTWFETKYAKWSVKMVFSYVMPNYFLAGLGGLNFVGSSRHTSLPPNKIALNFGHTIL